MIHTPRARERIEGIKNKRDAKDWLNEAEENGTKSST